MDLKTKKRLLDLKRDKLLHDRALKKYQKSVDAGNMYDLRIVHYIKKTLASIESDIKRLQGSAWTGFPLDWGRIENKKVFDSTPRVCLYRLRPISWLWLSPQKGFIMPQDILQCPSCRQHSMRELSTQELDQWYCVFCLLHIKKPKKTGNGRAVHKQYPKKVFKRGDKCFFIY